jgi:hypothetical protein
MRIRSWYMILLLLPLASRAAFGASASTSGPWHYTLYQARIQQQANFCRSQEDIRELAGIFNRYGPRTGYAALSESPGCSTSIQTFTPRKVVEEVIISKGKPGEYTMRFVEVHNDKGETLYLVTTREVRPD